MNTKKWTDDDSRWLRTNFGRVDLQTVSKELGFPLEEVEKRVKQLKLVVQEPASRKAPPVSLKEAQRELSAARKEYEKAIELFHKRSFDDAGRRFEDFIEKHPDEKEYLDRARMYPRRLPQREEEPGGSAVRAGRAVPRRRVREEPRQRGEGAGASPENGRPP